MIEPYSASSYTPYQVPDTRSLTSRFHESYTTASNGSLIRNNHNIPGLSNPQYVGTVARWIRRSDFFGLPRRAGRKDLG